MNLKALQQELAGLAVHSPVPVDLAVAVVNDCLRLAGQAPVSDAVWNSWIPGMHDLWPEQMGMLAWFLMSTSLQPLTVGWMSVGIPDAGNRLAAFFESIAPLTAEMMRANPFRQEEFLRRWATCWGARIEGETDEVSARRLEQLDYRKTLAEYQRAEATREAEAQRRLQLLEEARQRETDARGWRE